MFGDFHNVWGVFGGLGASNRKFVILGVVACAFEEGGHSTFEKRNFSR